MADDLTDRGAQDRSRINLEERWEISYWTDAFNCTEDELRNAVQKVGNQVDAVRNYFGNNRSGETTS